MKVFAMIVGSLLAASSAPAVNISVDSKTCVQHPTESNIVSQTCYNETHKHYTMYEPATEFDSRDVLIEYTMRNIQNQVLQDLRNNPNVSKVEITKVN